MALIDDGAKALRYARGLAQFWRAPLNRDDSTTMIRARMATREQHFVGMVHDSIWSQPGSPYRWLLHTAGITEADVAGLVRDEGLEGALQRLYDAGVYVTLDEFKGNVTRLQRGSQSLEIAARDFDNPLSTGHLTGATGGSRSRGTTLHLDLADVLDEVPARFLHLEASGLVDMPFCFWRPASSLATLRMILTQVKLGSPMWRWFSPTAAGIGGASRDSGVVFTWITLAVSQLMGHRLTPPEHVPLDQSDTVARWLAECTAAGRFMVFYAMANTGARLCSTALELGLDVHGHHLRTTAEPLTPAKADLYTRAGLSYSSAYGMSEAGGLGFSCGNPVVCDEMHLLSYRTASLSVPRTAPDETDPVGALWISVFSRSSPKVILNVETGDYAETIERTCGCPLEAAGLHTRVHTIRSYEKLTSAGNHFLGSALLDVLDAALPARFGGGPTDYQFVESEQHGQTRVRLLVSPRLGPLDEAEVVAFTLGELARRTRGGRRQAEIWRSSGTLYVERAQPYLTGAAKIQALHVERPLQGERPRPVDPARPEDAP